MNFPAPKTQPGVGHLGRWGRAPLPLLEEGAALGPVFRLRLWRPTVVGYSADWNRFVLGNVATFRSKGSMSGLSPYLGAGVVRTDEPEHRPRRRELNPHFTHRSVQDLRPCITDIAVRRLPRGPFDAVAWAAATVREILAATFFGGLFPSRLLAQFLRPLDRALPAPLLPRPWLFRRMNRALAHALAVAPPGTLGAALRELPGGLEETRVALSAEYDSTAHTLAWLLFHVILDSVLSAFAGSQLDHVQGDPRPRAAITLAPAEPLLLLRKV